MLESKFIAKEFDNMRLIYYCQVNKRKRLQIETEEGYYETS